MSNQCAIALCVHHKPWLMMSTLITLALQDWQDYDLYFVYQRGDGLCHSKPSYQEYYRLAEKYGVNRKLSLFDKRVEECIQSLNMRNVFHVEFENDQALDSGAWYKFIKTGLWKKYSHVFCMQEGNLLTRTTVLSAAWEFAHKNNVHFLSAGHEKQKLSKKLVMGYNTRKPNPTEMDYFHDKKMQEVFELFCRDSEFKRIFDAWGETEMITQNHIPDILLDSWRSRLRQVARSFKHTRDFPIFTRTICQNTYRRSLRNVIGAYQEYEKTIFHQANEPEWFGCSCQHMFSREFLERFSKKIAEHDLYQVIDVPFAGSALEIVWGFLPNWLGFEKWFFDGFHRVRKNFTNYKREDTAEGMCYYINRYFKGVVHVIPEGDFVKIDQVNHRYKDATGVLSDKFFIKG